jgi:hypothetical protein
VEPLPHGTCARAHTHARTPTRVRHSAHTNTRTHTLTHSHMHCAQTHAHTRPLPATPHPTHSLTSQPVSPMRPSEPTHCSARLTGTWTHRCSSTRRR